MAAPARTRRSALSLPIALLAALASAALLLVSARVRGFVGLAGVGRPVQPLRQQHVRRAQEENELGTVWIQDVSPKGRKVIQAYKALLSLKSSSEDEIAKVMSDLDGDQKEMLRGLIKARGGQDREITTTDPETGDTVERLYKKLTMIKDDDDVVLWRLKMDPMLLQPVQGLIEQTQMKLADEEGAKEHDDDDVAEQAWKSFQAKFPKAAENEVYMTTPCRSADIKYRFRRLKEGLEIDSAVALQIVERDCTPLFVDPDFIRRTWKAMVKVIGHEDALENIVLKHPGALVTQPQLIKAKINEIKTGAAVIDAFAGIGKLFSR